MRLNSARGLLAKTTIGSAIGAIIYTTLLGIFTISKHEMWRDELQAWLIARDSHTVANLFTNLRYEPHPGLWYLILYPVSHIYTNPIAMQIVSVVIAGGGAYLLYRFAPFSWWQKVLLSLGYFSLYEYGVIARNYGLGVDLLLGFCVLMTRARINYYAVGAVLFLLTQTNAFTALIVPALILYLALDLPRRRYADGRLPSGYRVACIAAGAGLALFSAKMLLPSDADYGHTHVTVAYGFASLWRAMMPIPLDTIQFWNTNIVLSALAQWIGSIGILGLAVWYFWSAPRIMALFLTGSASVILFVATLFGGAQMRHQGTLYVLLIMCVWLRRDATSERQPNPMVLQAAWILLLVVQVAASVIALRQDYLHPFSNGKAAAAWMTNSPYRDLALVIVADSRAAPLLGYGNRQAHFLLSSQEKSFTIWNSERQRQLTYTEARAQLQLYSRQHRTVLLVTPVPLTQSLSPGMRRRASFDAPAAVADEPVYFYEIPPQP